MAVFKVHKTSDYTVVSTIHLREKEMSLKAKGLLTIMLSLPENWDYSVIGLAALSKDGKDSVMGAIDELTEFGYLEVETKRNNKGQYDSIYNVYENPNRENRCGKSESDNPTQYNIDIKDNNITPNTLFPLEENKDIIPTETTDDGFENAWALYGRKGSKIMAHNYWKKLSKADREAIIQTIPLYLAAKPDEKFRKDFSGWINPAYRRWEDKIVGENNAPVKSHVFV